MSSILSVITVLLWSLSTILTELSPEIAHPCADAPSESALIICEQLHRWDKQARSKPPVGSFAALMPAIPGKGRMIAAELAPVKTSPYQCMDLECLCPYLRGRVQAGGFCYLPDGSRLSKAIRKEYRTLSDDERKRFHEALIKLKKSGEYDKLALLHGKAAVSGGAHSGPAFLPWHREFLKRSEIALRQIDPTVAVPYWDSTLDSFLPQPKDSALWIDELMGTTDENNNIIGGDFADFITFENHPHITRRVGYQGSTFTPAELNYVMNQNRIENVLAYTAPKSNCQYRANYNALEYTHGNGHIFVGGDMFEPYTSANDPVFYLHHSFVDMIWEMWRQQRQTRHQRENDYPPDNQACSSALHFGSALMRPFMPMRNIEGLSNKYTDNMYEFAPRPTCRDGPNCGSKYLFCDHSHGEPHCVAQARIGGKCEGFEKEDICHDGKCVSGQCVRVTNIVVTPKPVTTKTQAVIVTKAPVVSAAEDCYNEHECCRIWASQGECDRNQAYMNEWCKASCGRCHPVFDINAECLDYNFNCASWANNGECVKNPHWMTENCRQSCRKCDRTRMQVCMGETKTEVKVTTSKPRPQRPHCNSPGCYNENVCCPLWGLQGQCSKNVTWMACNCKVSCGLCIPADYDYGTCYDYHPNCSIWAARGECLVNAWMLENCRTSCRSCLDQWQLRLRCRIYSDFVGGNPGFIPGPYDDFYYDII